jgi:DNA-binding transcriptional MocR family regulator
VEQLALIKQRADPHTQNLVQLIARDLLENGAFDQHLVQLRAEHRRRRDAIAAALRRHGADAVLQWPVADGGLYLWCRLPPRLNAAAVLKRALAESVAFVRGQAFYVDHAGDRELRLCFSSISVNRADEVARRLVRSITEARRELVGAPVPLKAIG